MSTPAPDVALCRVLLFTPGNRPDRFAKAAATGADGLILDLEDAVSAAGKDEARDDSGRALPRRPPPRPRAGAGLRPAGQQHPHRGRRARPRRARHVRRRAGLRPAAEGRVGVRGALYARLLPAIPLVCTLESARGLEAATAIANADPRVRALAFGGVDLAADLRAELAWEPLLWGRGRLVQAAATAGHRRDRRAARRPRRRGRACATTRRARRRWATRRSSPSIRSRCRPILEVFTPTPAELERARAIVAA